MTAPLPALLSPVRAAVGEQNRPVRAPADTSYRRVHQPPDRPAPATPGQSVPLPVPDGTPAHHWHSSSPNQFPPRRQSGIPALVSSLAPRQRGSGPGPAPAPAPDTAYRPALDLPLVVGLGVDVFSQEPRIGSATVVINARSRCCISRNVSARRTRHGKGFWAFLVG